MPLVWKDLKEAGRGGLAFRMSLFILTATAVIFVAAFGYSSYYFRNEILANVERNAEAVTLATVSKIEVILGGVEKVPSYLARNLQGEKPTLPVLQKQIIDLLQTNPEIFGSTVAYEPYGFATETLYFAPYICRGKYGGLVPSFLGNEEYQYFYWDWYQIPKELGKAVWSEPYFDEGAGNIMMSTYSVPFYTHQGGGEGFQGDRDGGHLPGMAHGNHRETHPASGRLFLSHFPQRGFRFPPAEGLHHAGKYLQHRRGQK